MQPRSNPSQDPSDAIERGALREPEHEHQVEEELERLDGVALPRLGAEAHRRHERGRSEGEPYLIIDGPLGRLQRRVSSRLLTTGPTATVMVTVDRDDAAFRRPSTPVKGAVMHQLGIRSRAVAAITTALLSAGSLSGCAFLSRASQTGSDVQANADSYIPALSADGRWVAFWSHTDNLVPDDTNQQPDVFVRDNWTKAISRVSVSSSGTESTGTLDPSVSISDDGRVVAFVAFSGDLIAADTNNRLDVIWHDRDTDQDGIYDEPGGDRDRAGERPTGRSRRDRRQRRTRARRGRIRCRVPVRRTRSPRRARPRHERAGGHFRHDIRSRDGSADRDAHRQPLTRQPDSAGQRLQPAAEHRCDRHDRRVRDHGHQPRFRRHEQQFRRPRQRRHPDPSRYGCRASEWQRAPSGTQPRRYAHRVRLERDEPRAGRLVRERRSVRDRLRGYRANVARARRTGWAGHRRMPASSFRRSTQTGAVSCTHPSMGASCPSTRTARPTSSSTISRSGPRSG